MNSAAPVHLAMTALSSALTVAPPPCSRRCRPSAAARAAAGGKGFGTAPPAGAPPPAPRGQGYWNGMKISRDELAAKPNLRHPVILAGGRTALLWLVDGALYCTSASGTALGFPLVDAELLKLTGSNVPAVRCGAPHARAPACGSHSRRPRGVRQAWTAACTSWPRAQWWSGVPARRSAGLSATCSPLPRPRKLPCRCLCTPRASQRAGRSKPFSTWWLDDLLCV